MKIFFYLGFFPGYGVVLLQFLESLVPNLTLFLTALKYMSQYALYVSKL